MNIHWYLNILSMLKEPNILNKHSLSGSDIIIYTIKDISMHTTYKDYD